MAFLLPKIYSITDRELTGLSHAEQIKRLATGGATLVQMREKQMSGAELCDAAHLALAAAREHGVKLIINDRVDIAIVVGADGVHLGQDDLSPAEARKLLGDKAIIGYSTHTVSQASQATRLPIDYLAIGPVFSTTSKKDTFPTVGLEGVAAVRTEIGKLPLVAIGGINHGNAPNVIQAGADSLAVISALLGDPSTISRKTAALIELI